MDPKNKNDPPNYSAFKERTPLAFLSLGGNLSLKFNTQ